MCLVCRIMKIYNNLGEGGPGELSGIFRENGVVWCPELLISVPENIGNIMDHRVEKKNDKRVG